MIDTCGHHTCEQTHESVADRTKAEPVLSSIYDEHDKLKNNPPFAGDGYYFWEDNIDAAEWWGEVRYVDAVKRYRIFRIDLKLRYDDKSLIDLIGNRQHLKLMLAQINKARMKTETDGWKLHHFIAYFKRMQLSQPGIFPYKMIRFNDSRLNFKIQQPLMLNDSKKRILLNPFYIICVFDLNDLDLKTFKFIK